MAIIHWRPFRYIDEYFDGHPDRSTDLATDVYEEDKNIIVKIQIPGINPDNVSIEVEGDHLKVSGSREEEDEVKNQQYYHKEIRFGEFERIIPLPEAVEESEARAQYDDGILKILLPKADRKEKKTKIAVERT